MADQGPPPQAVLGQIINGYWVSQAVTAAARLGVAEQLTAGPKPVEVLAQAVGAQEDALYRLLRALASVGVFTETEGRTFAQTPLSDALRAGVPGSMRGLAVMTGLSQMRAWPEVIHSIKTGETAFKKVFGQEIFDYLPGDAEAAQAFDEAMASYTAGIARAVVGGYDFSAFRLFVDVGGSKGALLSAILHANASARGITFDLPHVTERARQHLADAGLAGRCEAVGGDFFAQVPAGGDAYTLKHILHDWDDARALAILRNVRQAIAPNGRLLVIEAVIPPGNAPSLGKFMDLNMLVMTGGRERTEVEYRALFAEAGFELTRVVPAHPMASVVEGRPR